MNIADLRREYQQASLDESQVDRDPLAQFGRWFDEIARVSDDAFFEANAMTLATTGLDGGPDARIVLLKGFDAQGLLFFTNYSSDKGRQLTADPRAAVVFYWPTLERQVRVRGMCERIPAEASLAYFRSRPRTSQLGAAVSRQSALVPNRAALDTELEHVTKLYEGYPVPMPDDWGGYLLRPAYFEFWQGRENRLHDRIAYAKVTDGWRITRLAP